MPRTSAQVMSLPACPTFTGCLLIASNASSSVTTGQIVFSAVYQIHCHRAFNWQTVFSAVYQIHCHRAFNWQIVFSAVYQIHCHRAFNWPPVYNACCTKLYGWVLLYVHKKRRLIRDGSPGRPPRLSHSSWALAAYWLKCCFTSTETVGLLGTGA